MEYGEILGVEHIAGNSASAKGFATSYTLGKQLVEKMQMQIHQEMGGSMTERVDGKGMGPGDAVHVAMGAAVAAIQNMAMFLKQGEGQNVNREQFMFAALMVATAITMTEDGLIVQNGPDVLTRTASNFERMTGTKADGFLNEGIVEILNDPTAVEKADKEFKAKMN